ncbi:tetratricopeptide repeat protein [Pseudomonadota bacterium]
MRGNTQGEAGSFSGFPGLKGVLVGAMMLSLGACQSVGQDTGFGKAESEPGALVEMDGPQRTLFEAGRDAEARHKYDVAANAYGRLFERRTQDAEVLAAFIRNMRYSGKAVDITNYVENKTQHLISDPYVKFEYSKALLAARRIGDAVRNLNETALLMPDNWRVQSALGIAYDTLGEYSRAIAAYNTALKFSPGNTVVLNNLAMSQAMAGQLAQAIGTLERAANLDRANPQIRQNLALLYAVNGEMEKARALAAMDLDSSDMEANLSFYRRFEGNSQ